MIAQSGRPISCFGVHPTDDFAQAYGAASHFCAGNAVPRGSLGETPAIYNIDLSAQYNLEIASTDVLLTLDIFNILDRDQATNVNEIAETGGGVADPDYGFASGYQRPRGIRLSARFNLF